MKNSLNKSHYIGTVIAR